MHVSVHLCVCLVAILPENAKNFNVDNVRVAKILVRWLTMHLLWGAILHKSLCPLPRPWPRPLGPRGPGSTARQ